MMRIRIEGIDIHYKNVADLDAKVHDELAGVRSKKLQMTVELKTLVRKERALTKFLGIQGQEKRLGIPPAEERENAGSRSSNLMVPPKHDK